MASLFVSQSKSKSPNLKEVNHSVLAFVAILIVVGTISKTCSAERYSPEIGERFSYAVQFAWDSDTRGFMMSDPWDRTTSMHLIDYQVLDSSGDQLVLEYSCEPSNYRFRYLASEENGFDVQLQLINRRIESARKTEATLGSLPTSRSPFGSLGKISKIPSRVERAELEKSHLLQCLVFRPMIFRTTGTITLDSSGNLIKHEGNQPLPFGLGELSALPFLPLPDDGKDASIDRKEKKLVRADREGNALDPITLVGTRSSLRKTSSAVPEEDWHRLADRLAYFEYKAEYRRSASSDETSYSDTGVYVFNPLDSMPEAASFTRVSKGIEYAGMKGKLKTNVKFRQFQPEDRWLILCGIFPQVEPLGVSAFPELDSQSVQQLKELPDLESNLKSKVFDHISRHAPPDCESELQTQIEELANQFPLKSNKGNLPFQLRDAFVSSPKKSNSYRVTVGTINSTIKNAATQQEADCRLAQRVFLNWDTRRQNARTHVRSWRDASGKFALNATLSGRIGDTVVLRSAKDQSVKRVPIDRLDKTSQFIIKHYAMTPEALNRSKAILSTFTPTGDEFRPSTISIKED